MKRIIGIVVSIAVLFLLLYLRPLIRFTDDVSRGNALTEKGDFNSAFFAYGNAIQRSPTNPLPYFKRAIAMYKAQSFSKSQADLNDVVRLAPKFGAAYRLRAMVTRQQGLEKKAKEDDAIADQLSAPTDLESICSQSPS